MAREGNDARHLSFPGWAGRGGHSNPAHPWAWAAGCLGITEACGTGCEASFETCVTKDGFTWVACEGKLKGGQLQSCTVGCAPTLAMLELSEKPVTTLSEGKFGTRTGIAGHTPANGASAPKPKCTGAFGKIPDGQPCHA